MGKNQGTNDLDMSLGKKLLHVTVIHIFPSVSTFLRTFITLMKNTCFTLGN